MKRMTRALSVVWKLAFAIGLIGVFSCSDKTTYNRSECIVRIDIDSPLTGRVREEAISKAVDAIYSYPEPNYEGPTPSLTINKSRDSIYLQFPKKCELKHHWAKVLVGHRMQPVSPEGFKLTMSTEYIEPGIDTISIQGEAWID